jgi:eukaryotic-like serine/threonine-protein kinase
VRLTDFARARSLLPGRVATTLPRPQGDVFYCSPEALLGREEGPRSDLFSLGLVLLELATWRHLYSMADVRPRDLKIAIRRRLRWRRICGRASLRLASPTVPRRHSRRSMAR